MSAVSYSKILRSIKTILVDSNDDALAGLDKCCFMLRKNLIHYDWVGFYFADFKNKILHLKAFSGASTEHDSIPFGKGICGQVAVSNQNFIAYNVKEQENYIACNLSVQSEIVVPLFFEGKNIGQIDVDSNKINSFSKKDEILLEACCDLISKTYGSLLLSL